ncbi:OsmC family protein [Sphingomonas adhaesiva]|uniref:OsmC family protein n=1 Tax=Sphingomonas adhaesiva TaxID=28212 RepID=UPI002FF4E42A
MSKTVVSYEGNLRSQTKHEGSGAIIVMDAPKELGGLGEGQSASDLLGVSLGGCILGIMGITARSMNVDIVGATATIVKEMANAPRRFAHLSVAITIPGRFDYKQRRRLEAAAHARPVHNALGIEAPITFDWVG